METAVQSNEEFFFATVDIPVLRDKSIAPTARLIFAVLCSFASVKDRTAWPSNETMAEIVGVSVATVKRAYKELKEKGVITRSPRFMKDRIQVSSLTRIIGHKAPCYAKKTTSTETTSTETTSVETVPSTETVNAEIPRAEKNAEEKRSDLTQLMNKVIAKFTYEPAGDLPMSRQEFTCERKVGSPVSYRTRINEQYIKDSLTREACLPNFTERAVKGNTYDGRRSQTGQAFRSKNSKEAYTLEDTPDIMRTTAEFFLHKTGRQGLMWSEISALRQLAATQYPIRVQKEICTAVNRFLKRGQSLSALTFCYIAGSLKNQPTWGRKSRAKPKPNPMHLTQAEIDAKQHRYTAEDMARIEAMMLARG